jgi:hypothetical protein
MAAHARGRYHPILYTHLLTDWGNQVTAVLSGEELFPFQTAYRHHSGWIIQANLSTIVYRTNAGGGAMINSTVGRNGVYFCGVEDAIQVDGVITNYSSNGIQSPSCISGGNADLLPVWPSASSWSRSSSPRPKVPNERGHPGNWVKHKL